MTRGEAIEAIKAKMGYYESDKRLRAALETLIPELAESDDERIRKWLYEYIERVGKTWGKPGPFDYTQILAWLEKQKEQNEELVYRLNGLMQEYFNESKDEAEQEHRFKCYKLFWNALEDTSYFDEQKEQKPVQTEDEREYVRTLKSLIADFLRGKEEVDRSYYQKIYDWLDGRHIEQKPVEWSEEDELKMNSLLNYLDPNKGGTKYSSFAQLTGWYNWLKSLRPHWKPSEEQMNGLAHAINLDVYDAKRYGLDSLYNDLKKLM